MNQAMPSPPGSGQRLHFLDILRGLTLIEMMLYHFLWDLVYIAGISIPWYLGTAARVWQQSICWTFILLSGFCWPLGRHHLKRGLTVFCCGGAVTLVTLAVLPQDRVVFGVLTLIGSCMLLMIPLDRLLRRIRPPAALAGLAALSFFLFLLFFPAVDGRLANFPGLWQGGSLFRGGYALPAGLYRGWVSAYLGFPPAGFYSTDYFPLLPWFFLFLTGYLGHRVWGGGSPDGSGLPARSGRRSPPLPWAAWIGRHSLPLYLLHQPVLYGVTLIIMRFGDKFT